VDAIVSDLRAFWGLEDADRVGVRVIDEGRRFCRGRLRLGLGGGCLGRVIPLFRNMILTEGARREPVGQRCFQLGKQGSKPAIGPALAGLAVGTIQGQAPFVALLATAFKGHVAKIGAATRGQ